MSRKVISIIGIGRVGLPLAVFLADQGHKVFGIGKDQFKLDLINKGKMPFIENGTEKLKKYINKRIFISTSEELVKKSNIIILTLGTPIDENMNPVLDQINSVMEKIIPFLKKGQLLILRSTVSPRTTIYVKDQIELNTKLKVGRDIFLAFCPERIAEGNSIKEIKEIPQIIGY